MTTLSSSDEEEVGGMASPSGRDGHEPSPDGLGHSVAIPDAAVAAMLGDMFGALERIFGLTHNEKGLTSRQVNKVAFSTIARVLAAGGPLPAQAMSASGQDPQGLGAKPASAVRGSECAQTPSISND